MIDDDFPKFSKLWSGAVELKGGKALSENALEMVFELFVQYDFETVKAGVYSFINAPTDPKSAARWSIDPTEVLQQIRGKIPDANTIIGLARSLNTPVGCFALMTIGSHDLSHNSNAQYLAQRAEHVRALLPDFIRRARQGRYTPGEISVMKKYNIDFMGPMCHGLPGPRNPAALENLKQIAQSVSAHEPALLEAPAPAVGPDSAKIKELMSALKIPEIQHASD